MPAKKQDKVSVACPHCGHSQEEPRTAFSTVCKSCRKNFRVQEVLNPVKKAAGPAPERRRITCSDCGTELEVAVTAQSSMCKRCSRYIDLQDYKITNAVSKNFKTKGTFALEPTGYVFNTKAVVGDAVIKGKFLGKLIAERSLAIYTTAEIKGSFKAGLLIIPAANRFRWVETIKVGSAEIAGELAANLEAEGTIILKSTARMFGDLQAGGLVVEDGAVVVGNAKIIAKREPGPEQPVIVEIPKPVAKPVAKPESEGVVIAESAKSVAKREPELALNVEDAKPAAKPVRKALRKKV